MDNLLPKSVFSFFLKLPIHAVWKLVSTVTDKRIQAKCVLNIKLYGENIEEAYNELKFCLLLQQFNFFVLRALNAVEKLLEKGAQPAERGTFL